MTQTQRVTTTGTVAETQEAAQRVAGKLMDEGYTITGTSAPFQDPEHTSSPDPAGFWSIDLTYAKLDEVVNVPSVFVDEPTDTAPTPEPGAPETDSSPSDADGALLGSKEPESPAPTDELEATPPGASPIAS